MCHQLAEQSFGSYEDVKKWLEWFAANGDDFYCRSIHKLSEIWGKWYSVRFELVREAPSRLPVARHRSRKFLIVFHDTSYRYVVLHPHLRILLRNQDLTVASNVSAQDAISQQLHLPFPRLRSDRTLVYRN